MLDLSCRVLRCHGFFNCFLLCQPCFHTYFAMLVNLGLLGLPFWKYWWYYLQYCVTFLCTYSKSRILLPLEKKFRMLKVNFKLLTGIWSQTSPGRNYRLKNTTKVGNFRFNWGNFRLKVHGQLGRGFIQILETKVKICINSHLKKQGKVRLGW